MNIRYVVELTQDERDALKAMLSGGKHPARKLKRAQILLAADAALGDGAIAAATRASGSTIYPTKRRFVEGNRESRGSAERGTTASCRAQADRQGRRHCWWRPLAPSHRRAANAGP